MDFFKSILLDDPSPDNLDKYDTSDADQATERAENEYTDLDLDSNSAGEVVAAEGGGSGSLWSFGDLVKTLTTKSESVLETYRHDLKEFGSGLRKESDLFREVASRAVKELPSSMEVGATAIDGVLKSTVDIISQGKNVLLESSDIDDSDTSESVQNSSNSDCSRVYSRFDSQLNAIQTDIRTYTEDPEDLNDYNKWKLGFVVADKESEIEKLFAENESVEAIYKKVVDNEVVDDKSFWCRYFYRVYKLKQQEDMRANLVRRSLTVDDEQDLSWDVDDDDDNENDKQEEPKIEIEKKQNSNHESETVDSNIVDENVPKTDENPKASLQNEEDLEWDEIGDIGENDDEKNVSHGENVKNIDVIKRLNVGEDDEDLSWDIEDDDEPVKASSSK